MPSNIKTYKIFLEALKDEISPIQKKYVGKWSGKKFLNYDVPKKTNLIPDGKWKLSDEDKTMILNSFFNTDMSAIKEYLNSIPKELEKAIYNAIFDKDTKNNFKNFDISRLSIRQMYELYDNSLYLISTKETNSNRLMLRDKTGRPILDPDTNKPQFILKEKDEIVYSKNVGNINKFIEYWNIAFPNNKVEPFIESISKIIDIVKTRRSIINFNIFNQNDMYLLITSKPSETLNMSASIFYTSCQDLYKDTGYNKQILSNVFDSNSKVCYIIFDTPYYLTKEYKDKGQKVSDYIPLCRTMIRIGEKLRETNIYFDRTYPTRVKYEFYSIINKYTNITPSQIDKYKSLVDIDIDDHLPAPYMDRLSIQSDKKIGVNTKVLKIDDSFISLISYNKVIIDEDNKVQRIIISVENINRFEKLFNKPLEQINEIFPTLKRIEVSDIKEESEILEFNSSISIYKSQLKLEKIIDFIKDIHSDVKILEITSCPIEQNMMPDISSLNNLVELNIFYTYKYLSESLLNLQNLKVLRISNNIVKYNIDLLKKIKQNGVKVEKIGL